MSGKKGYISRDQQNKNQPLFLTFILRTFDKNFAQLQERDPMMNQSSYIQNVLESSKCDDLIFELNIESLSEKMKEIENMI